MHADWIEWALKDGCRLRGFLSGSGVRVIRLEKDGMLRGYGEDEHVHNALEYAGEDYLAGLRPYGEAHGVCIGASSKSDSILDEWLVRGLSFSAWQEGDDIVVQLKGFIQVDPPDDVVKSVITDGTPRIWKQRGFTYATKRMCMAHSDEPWISTKVIGKPPGADAKTDPWFYWTTKTGRDKDFRQAVVNAFAAADIEIKPMPKLKP